MRHFSIAHITDTHGCEKNLAAILPALRQYDMLVHTGDFVNYYNSVEKNPALCDSALKQIRYVLTDLRHNNVFYVPGNHDSQEIISDYQPCPKVHIFGNIYAIFLQSCSRNSGKTGEQLNRWFEYLISQGERYIVFSHFGPTHCETGYLVRSGQAYRQGFREIEYLILKHTDQILALFHGHTHTPYRNFYSLGNTLVVNPGTAAHGFWAACDILNDGTLDVSVRLKQQVVERLYLHGASSWSHTLEHPVASSGEYAV